MLRVSLSEVKPIANKVLPKYMINSQSAANNTVKSTAKKATPAIVILGNGMYALTAANASEKKSPKYEPCSDFCMEVVG